MSTEYVILNNNIEQILNHVTVLKQINNKIIFG